MKELKIKMPTDCLGLLSTYKNKRQEHFGIICLDSGNNVIGKKVLFIGGVSRAIADTKVVLWTALTKKSSAVILFHNHPSGNTSPSREDIETTDTLKRALKLCGVCLLDHIIIGKYSYFSFNEHRLIDNENSTSMVADRG